MLLAKKNPYVSGEISIFDTLVRAGEEKSSVALPFQLHTFLVDCLVEHVRDTGIVHHVLAVTFLSSATKLGEQGNVLLKRTGDAALILAGFFPERALRLNVSSSYFRCMGQAAYGTLAAKLDASEKSERGEFYEKVTRNFDLLEKVLDATRTRSTWELYQRFRASLQ